MSGPSCGLWGSVCSARGGLLQLEVGLSPCARVGQQLGLPHLPSFQGTG